MAPTVVEQVALEQLSDGEFVSKLLPIHLGNANIAYGGCAAAYAVSAACLTVGPSLALYSVLGHFHGPASVEAKMYCSVQRTRDTRSFATRRVQVKQRQPDGSMRVCLELMADFHAIEASTLEYSARPSTAWPKPGDCPDVIESAEKYVAQGKAARAMLEAFRATFGILADLFEQRYCPNGVAGQNLNGILSHEATTQDALHVTDKMSAEWQRARAQPQTVAEKMSVLAFFMDSALSFVPLTHSHKWFDSTTACSTLDFALRVYVPEVDMGQWHLRERGTQRAGNNRTYSESKLWSEDGALVASMSQQSILRLRKDAKPARL